MTRLTATIAVLASLTQVEAATINAPGVIGCPNVSDFAVHDFDQSKLEGKWYEIEKDWAFPWTSMCNGCTT